ncbi:hypothetical protein GCM10012284_30920 [Mangrovihabitans endophyticus]|uniref:Uncharacterized protein n=2 Tax=Mangrovihabitans endophyticus TaxID=1751298 RepID=A0A8J3BZ06_9ACTN|nr:hypothetical protein GCM10012284_30920 [Mangrovihabitans endophyticus]
MGAEDLNSGSATAQDRFSGGVSAYRQSRREASDAEGDLLSRHDGSALPTRTPGMSSPLSAGLDATGPLDRAAKLPSLDLHGMTEPVLPPAGLPETLSLSMADHPLLRGLLLELPARGTLPSSDWLDRWFEAARSILELLYVQEARRG